MSGKKTRHRKGDKVVLARIVEEIVDRRRAGQSPRLKDYAQSHPELAGVIARRMAVIDFLESAGAAGNAATQAGSVSTETPLDCDLSTAIAELPERDQRLVYLRLFRRRPWSEIAAELGGEEEALRREHAGAVRRLIERCQNWLSQPVSGEGGTG